MSKKHPPRTSTKEQKKQLTYAQAKELKWFCGNVTGLRQEYYALIDQAGQLAGKLARLERTVELIETFLKEQDSEKEMACDPTRGGAVASGPPAASGSDQPDPGPGGADRRTAPG